MLASPDLLAKFNTWANTRVLNAAAGLPATEISKDRGAFFGSILGTLNHIYLVDLLYQDRIEGRRSTFKGLDDILHADIAKLAKAQSEIDTYYRAYADGLSESDLAGEIVFTTLLDEPEEWRVPLMVYLTNLAQHQVHHRGQAHALLSQAGVDVPSIGFIEYCMEEESGMVSHKPVGRK
ncbi:MAG: DinB family protein [Alphaproteobacteria bacterium]|jgi:uncharacterized damage-inducible protein DinB